VARGCTDGWLPPRPLFWVRRAAVVVFVVLVWLPLGRSPFLSHSKRSFVCYKDGRAPPGLQQLCRVIIVFSAPWISEALVLPSLLFPPLLPERIVCVLLPVRQVSCQLARCELLKLCGGGLCGSCNAVLLVRWCPTTCSFGLRSFWFWREMLDVQPCMCVKRGATAQGRAGGSLCVWARLRGRAV